MFPDYSTFRTYHFLHNRYYPLECTPKIPIEGIGTAVYTFNCNSIITHNSLHIPALSEPLCSLHRQREHPGCGVYSSYKDGYYLFFPDLVLQVEESFDKIISYSLIGCPQQGHIAYKEPKDSGISHTNLASVLPSKTTPHHSPQPSPHIISCDN